MRLPRLPVSRRRHEARIAELDLRARELTAGSRHLQQRVDWAKRERDEAREALLASDARVVELEQAIREVRKAHTYGEDVDHELKRLYAVLDGHEETPASRWQPPDEVSADAQTHQRQERGDTSPTSLLGRYAGQPYGDLPPEGADRDR